jgi:hypothetical protein
MDIGIFKCRNIGILGSKAFSGFNGIRLFLFKTRFSIIPIFPPGRRPIGVKPSYSKNM